MEAEFDTSPHRRHSTETVTLGAWCDEFIKTKRADGAREGTLTLYDIAKRFLVAFFGEGRRLNEISKQDARRFATAIRNNELNHVRTTKLSKPMSLITARKHLSHCRSIFAAADAELDDVVGNPFVVVKLPQVPASEWERVDADIFWKLYDAAQPSWRVLLALCRMAGLRRSDALALRWYNVDFKSGVLSVRQHKTGVDCAPPICPELHDLLVSAPGKFETDSFVVPRPIYVGNIDRDFLVLCRHAKVKPFSKPLHTLRKSCIDDWAKVGYPPSVVQAWAGHKNIKTTMMYYSKVDKRDVKRATTEAFLPRNDAIRDAIG